MAELPPLAKEGPMPDSWVAESPVLAMIAIFILLPVVCIVYAFAAWTFRRYRERRILRCPERKRGAQVTVDAVHAALSSIIGQPCLRIKDCSLWADEKDCTQTCVKPSRAGALSGAM
jgi:hypothetical protein